MENDGFVSGPVGIRVLVVEEDPADLAALSQILQRHGYQVTAMASPEEGLRALRENPEGFDLVMTVVHTQGPGIDGFELLKHAKNRYPVILFSGYEPTETVMRAMIGGACDILVKPLRDEEMQNIWHHVLRRQANAASGAAVANADAPIGDVVVRQDDTARKRGSAALDDSDEGDSHGSRQQKQARTTNRTMLNSSAQLHASVVRAAEQLRGTEDYGPRGILDLLVSQGVEVTAEHVTGHLEKYRRGCLTNHPSAMPIARSSLSNNTRNYWTPANLGFHMSSHDSTNINQTRLLRNGASPVGCGVYGNFSENANGYHFGNGVNSLFPNPMGQEEFPRVSRLRYDGKTGGISMLPWPVPPVDDDGEELLRSYLEGDNEVMHTAATTAQGMQGDGSADAHVSASSQLPQDFTDLLSWENADGNGTAGTSGGSGGVVADGIVDCELSQDEMINFF